MHRSLRRALLICASILCATWVYAGNELRDALERKPNLRHGRALFEKCAACHQADGSGVGAKGIPNISGQHYEFIVKQIADFRDTERLDIRMESSTSQHYLRGAQDLADVAAYISRLPTRSTNDVGSAKNAYAGKLAYDRGCAQCHGAFGEGNGRLRYPRLAGQHYTYLMKQIDAMVGGYRANVSWDHAQMLASLKDEEMTGVADYLSRLNSSNANVRQR